MAIFKKNKDGKDTTHTYTCTVCGKTLHGLDVSLNVKERNKKRDFFYKRTHAASVPTAIQEAFDYRDSHYHCSKCLRHRSDWDVQFKSCVFCEGFVANLTNLPGVPIFTCKFQHDAEIHDPYSETCPQWVITNVIAFSE